MATTTAHPVARAEGASSVAIAAPVRGAMIVTGHNNTVEMQLTGVGAVLAFAFRWNRPRPRKRRDRRHAGPTRLANHVDREAQIDALVGIDGAPRVVNVYGAAGIGKTHVLVEALNRDECAMPDGIVYLDGRGQSADDLLHAVFDELYECRVQRRDLRIERLLSSRQAVVALEDVELAPDASQRLVLGAPRCRLLVTSRSRVLFDATPVSLSGLAPDHAAAIAEQELGRPLSAEERRAAESISARLDGHPLALRQAFSIARDEGRGRPLDELESWLTGSVGADDRIAALTPVQRRAVRALAVHGDAPLGDEHLRAIAGPEAVAAAIELEDRHDTTSHSPRHSLVGILAQTLPQEDLVDETERALEHFTAWSGAHGGDGEAVLREAAALLALLERAHAAQRWSQVIALGRAVEDAYVLGQRWEAWGRVLGLVLDAARRGDDLEAEGWARHQLGTRAYGVGDADTARASLQQALALRERIGDHAGAAATRQNLRVVGGRTPLLYRLSHVSLVVVAIVCALLIGSAGVAGAGILSSGGAGTALVVGVQGDGAVVSDDGSVRCAGERCATEHPVNTELLLRARPERGSEFARWDGACSGRGACRVLLTADTGVIAVFKPVRAPHDVTVRIRGEGTVVSHPAGIACGADEECEATFTRSREVRLTAAAATGYRFAGWSNDCKGVGRCAIGGDERRSVVTARFVADADAVRLAVDLRGSGLGKVVSRQSGIDCGELCAAGFKRGARVHLAAVAQPGSRFAGWSDPSCGSRTAKTCTVTLVRSSRVAARFARHEPLPPPREPDVDPRDPEPTTPTETTEAPAAARHTLRVLHTGTGRGTVTSQPAGIRCGDTCEAGFEQGSRVTLTATAAGASDFIGWTGAGCPKTGSCVVTLDRAQSVQARFDSQRPTTYGLTVSVTGKGAGSVTSRPAGIRCGDTCLAGFEQGTRVTLLASADAASEFAGWSGAECPGTGPCFVTVDAARSVVARFELKPPPTLTVTVAGWGSVTSAPAGIECDAKSECSASFPYGEPVTLTASPNQRFVFTGWSDPGCAGTGPCVVTMTSAQSVTARFDPRAVRQAPPP